jgi:hypothetical protein
MPTHKALLLTEQESLVSLRQHCTTVIVAHRLSTIADADTIVVMEAGSVAEAGSHQELLQRGGLYAGMWQRQLEAGGSSQEHMKAAQVATAGVGDAAGAPADAGEATGEEPAGPRRTCSPTGAGLSLVTSRATLGRDDEDDEEGEEHGTG